jgi:sarcosine oxidase subunit beta
MASLNVVVIGAGTLGMSAALSLAERGAAVTVIEADSVAAGSSGRSVGVVGTQHVDPFEVLIRSHSVRRLREWRARGLNFNPIGYLRLGRTTEDMALFSRSLEMQRAVGLSAARVLDSSDLRKLVPHMNTAGLAGGLFGSEDGFLDPHQMCSLLSQFVREHGGAVRQGCRVTAVERAGHRFRLVTTTGSFETDAIVNAAGPWAGKVAALLGQSLHIVPERHEAVSIRLDRPLDYVMPMVMDLVLGRGTGLNFRHERAGELISELHKSSGEGEDPDNYNQLMNEDGKERLAELLLERLPDLPGPAFTRGWAGLYPRSHDGRPYVGPVDAAEPRLVTAAGAGGYGIQLGPVIGQLAADWVLDGAPTSIPEASRLLPTPDRNPAAA